MNALSLELFGKSRDDLESMGHGLMVDSLISQGLARETNVWQAPGGSAAQSARVISNLFHVTPTVTYKEKYASQ